MAHSTDLVSSAFPRDTSLQEQCTVLSTSVPHPPLRLPSLCPSVVMPRSGSKTGTEALSSLILSFTEGSYSLEDILSTVYRHQNVKNINRTGKKKKPQLVPLAVSDCAFT